MQRFFMLMAAILIVDATGIHAQQLSGTQENPHRIPDSIVVTANRTATPRAEIASSVTVITRADLKKSQSVMVMDILREVPGLDVVQSGGAGKLTSLFLRGASSHHTLVLLDGIQLNDPSSPDNNVDLSNLRTENIARIEILRGPQSVLYGPEAIGGVIQIFTQSGGSKTRLSISSEAGAFRSFNESIVLSGSLERIRYSLSAAQFDSDGISASDADNGSTEKDGYQNTQLSSRLDISMSKASNLTLTGRFTDSNSDIDKTSDILDDPNYISDRREQQYGATFSCQPENSPWRQQLVLSISDIKRTTTDGYDIAHPADSELTRTDGDRISISWQHMIQISKRNSLTAGIETERSAFSSDLFFRSGFGDFVSRIDGVHAWTRGLFVLNQMRVGERLFLSAGGRIDEHKQFGTTGTYRLTSAYLFDRVGLRIRGVIGTGYKAPSLFQLYHPSVFFGNPDLKPEKSLSWELGVEQEFLSDRLLLMLTYFDNDIKNLIQGIENIARATSRGIETALSLTTGPVHTRLDYTFTESQDKTLHEELIRRPKHKLSFVTEYRPAGSVGIRLAIRHTGQRDDLDFRQPPATRVTLGDYTVINVAGSFAVNKNLELTWRVDNLFDANYQEVFTYGNIPVSAHAGFRVSL